MKKKGVSPVVATILLVAIVIILAIIIFLWARGFVAEKAQKDGRAVELSCAEVNIDAGIALVDGTHYLDVVNRGDIPLYGFEVKEFGPGTLVIRETLQQTVTVGNGASIDLQGTLDSGTEILVVPIILGETDSGKVAHTCPDEQGFGTFVP